MRPVRAASVPLWTARGRAPCRARAGCLYLRLRAQRAIDSTKATCASNIAIGSIWRSTRPLRTGKRVGKSGSACTPTGQPRDRIEYARHRTQAFASGDLNRPSLEIGEADGKKSEARQFYLVVPSPTSVHAPPPPIATRWYADAGNAPAVTTEQAEAPSDQCVAGCRGKFTQCEEACASDAGAPSPSCKGCDPDYKRCMKRCFE